MSDEQKSYGSLVLGIGPMFSGKTTWLVGELTKAADVGYRALLVSSTVDTRLDTVSKHGVTSHNSGFRHLSDRLTHRAAGNLSELNVTEYNFVGIDEGQFFPDLAQVVLQWVDSGIGVRVAALSGDAMRCPFGPTFDLIPHCDDIRMFHAICTYCDKEIRGAGLGIPAPFTRRITGGSEQLHVGTLDFRAACRRHYREHE
jgi:thymidine kinase